MRFIPYLLSGVILLLTACAPQMAVSTPRPADLTPYLTATRSTLQSTPVSLVAAETPLPTSTPFTYSVKAGDTISSIALQFGVSIDELIAVNPEISPRAMSIGTVLKIPSNPDNPSGESTPTPAPLTVEQIECYPTANQGMWCFVLVHNDHADFMENVSAQVTLVDSDEVFIASQAAFLPLNILPPNTSLPLTVYFPPNVPLDAQPQVQILTAILLQPNDPRYLPATVNNTLVQINADGHFASITGEVRLPAESNAATQTWVAAVAYDESGRVVGIKRWEGGRVQPGRSLNFEMSVASLGGRMTRVEFVVEARP
ncbi:MAG TPA: LysM peptidoglycan-binding domain-containing protein [Anaerolineales bacterium]|nr:LysM peptidoglycan-binding domain-containing protein [Anaerolineales bacterium]